MDKPPCPQTLYSSALQGQEEPGFSGSWAPVRNMVETLLCPHQNHHTVGPAECPTSFSTPVENSRRGNQLRTKTDGATGWGKTSRDGENKAGM